MEKCLKECDSAAKQRWRLLGKALMNKKLNNEIKRKTITSDVSVRRFSTYGLLETKKLPSSSLSLSSHSSSSSLSPSSGNIDDYSWFHYSSISYQDFCISVRHLKQQFSPEELIGFNNTGNVCVWPSEEVLAHYCLTHRDLFREKTVCELGGGMTCLAGIAVACTSEAAQVILTDGNDLSCKNIEVILEKNRDKFARTEVNVRNLRWNEEGSSNDLRKGVDVILCADCLFFDQYRSDLVKTIDSLLSTDGFAVIFAPRRNRTLDDFCEQAQYKFHLTVEENYDPTVWNVYQQAKTQGKEVFDEDIHYPLKITLNKKGRSEVNHLNGTKGHSEVNHLMGSNGHCEVNHNT